MQSMSRQWRKYLEENLTVGFPLNFQPHKTLNQDFWNQPGDKLDPEIREKLLEIATDFIEKSEAAEAPIKDITFTGSLANYNYSPFSD